MPDFVQPTPQDAEAELLARGIPRIEGGSQEGDAAPAAEAEAEPSGEGQGEEGTGGLYDLSSVPEDLRQFVEPHLKAMEGNATRRFQQYSEQLNSWKPYEELGIQDVDPGQLQQLLDFAQLAQDEEQFAEWWRGVGERLGLMDEGAPEGEIEDDLFGEDLTPERVKELVAEAVAEATQPLTERFTQSEQERAEAEALTGIQAQLQEIREEHGDDIDTDAILRFAYTYAEDDPDNAIDRGLQDYLKLIGKGEAGLFADKSGQPKPVEGAGSADTSPEPIVSFEDAKKAGIARLRAANSV